MTVFLNRDTKALAQAYDEVSESQFRDGCLLVEKLGIRAGQTVVDIGCGTGRLSRYVAGVLGSSGRLFGFDPMMERVQIAIDNNMCSNAAFGLGAAEDLNMVADGSVDVAYLNWVFHWVRKEAALQELVRVLKPEGKAGITIPTKDLNETVGFNRICDRVLSRAPYAGQVLLDAAPQKKYNLPTSELIGLLTAAGLRVADIQILQGQRRYRTSQEIIDFSESSLFGNFLSHVPEALRNRAKEDIKAEFEKYRSPDGLRVSYYTTYVVAEKAGEGIL